MAGKVGEQLPSGAGPWQDPVQGGFWASSGISMAHHGSLVIETPPVAITDHPGVAD